MIDNAPNRESAERPSIAARKRKRAVLVIRMSGADFSDEVKDRCAVALGRLLAAHFLTEAANDNSPTGNDAG